MGSNFARDSVRFCLNLIIVSLHRALRVHTRPDTTKSFLKGSKTISSSIHLLAVSIWAISWENLLMPYENNKDADPRSLISAFVVRCMNSIISLVSTFAMSWLACFCSWAGWFVSYLVKKSRRQVFLWCGSFNRPSSLKIIILMGRVKRICVFEHSLMTNFNCACPAIQRG